PPLVPIATFAFCKLQGLLEPTLTAGWESELPLRGYGDPVDKRPTPIWMAQRTTSVHWSPSKKFKLSRYTEAPLEVPPEWSFGFTCVPVPGPGDEMLGTPYPAMWLQFDGDFTHDFAIRPELKL